MDNGITASAQAELSRLRSLVSELERDLSNSLAQKKTLQDREAQFWRMVEDIIDVIFEIDLQGVINSISDNLGGYDREDIIGKTLLDLVHPDDRDMLINLFVELKTGVEKSLTYRIKNKSGEFRWVKTKTKPKIENGIFIGAVGTLIDITDQRQAEEARRRTEENFRHSLDNAPLGIRIVSEKGETIYANQMILDIYGLDSLDELKATPVIERYTPESFLEFQMRREKRKQGNYVPSEYRISIVRKDGEIRHLHVFRKEVLWDGAKQFQVIYRDYTEQKQAEEALRESEARSRDFFENSSEAIFVIQDNKLVFLNPKTVDSSGYEVETLLSRMFPEFIHQADREMVMDRHHRRMKGEEITACYPFRIIHGDGNIRWVEMNAVTINWQGKTATLNFMRDITERKREEDEKRKLEERLLQATKMEAIGTLAGGIAHDFNNLLMGIQGYVSLMMLDLDPSHPHYKRIKQIEDQVKSGAALTRQLLGFARGGRYEIKTINMNDIVDKISSMFDRTRKEVTINRRYGKDLWTAEVDRGQMEQVLMNLYVNALQAMPKGGMIYLETENILLDKGLAFPYAVTPGRYVKISMTDTGTGMDEKTKERIFDPFFTTKEMGRGTGLGLAMVYGIIKGHKGMINVYSEPGQGTTFTIYLPASEKEAMKEKAATGTLVRGSETILLVDDERTVLEVNRELLEALGYRIYIAGSGQEAISLYREKRDIIDLVIVDMIMPGISGGEVFDRLRQIDPDIRVILSSGYSIEGKAQAILDRGCNGFLQKPFQMADLSRKLREVFDCKSGYETAS